MRTRRAMAALAISALVVGAAAGAAALNLRLLDAGRPDVRGHRFAIAPPSSLARAPAGAPPGTGAAPDPTAPVTVPGRTPSRPRVPTSPTSVPPALGRGATAPPGTAAPTTAPAPPERRTYDVADAGAVTVMVSSTRVDVASVETRPGWTANVATPGGDHFAVDFRRSNPEGEAGIAGQLTQGVLQIEVHGAGEPDD